MKTPEEIKKGLECYHGRYRCAGSGCPYSGTDPCLPIIKADALAYIEQLEAENKRLQEQADKLLEMVQGDCRYCKYYDNWREAKDSGEYQTCLKCILEDRSLYIYGG